MKAQKGPQDSYQNLGLAQSRWSVTVLFWSISDSLRQQQIEWLSKPREN